MLQRICNPLVAFCQQITNPLELAVIGCFQHRITNLLERAVFVSFCQQIANLLERAIVRAMLRANLLLESKLQRPWCAHGLVNQPVGGLIIYKLMSHRIKMQRTS